MQAETYTRLDTGAQRVMNALFIMRSANNSQALRLPYFHPLYSPLKIESHFTWIVCKLVYTSDAHFVVNFCKADEVRSSEWAIH